MVELGEFNEWTTLSDVPQMEAPITLYRQEYICKQEPIVVQIYPTRNTS